jgi:hypothetical protein
MKWIVPILISLPVICLGQGNLVLNSSFENLTGCPWNNSHIELATSWMNVGGGGTADLYNTCFLPLIVPPDTFPINGVPSNSVGFQVPHSGDGYAGFYFVSDPETYPNQREYIQARLLDTLQAFTSYEVTLYISLADKWRYGVGSVGVFFADSMINRETMQFLDVVPQIQSPTGIIYDDKENWMEVRDTFNSRFGGESWIVIGNFLPDSLSLITFVDSGAGYNYDRSYYYIDDVSVIALDTPSGVVETEKLLFRIYPNPATEVVQIKGQGLVKARLLDMSGREVLRSSLLTTREVNIGHLPLGLYLLEVTDKEGRKAVQKLVVH